MTRRVPLSWRAALVVALVGAASAEVRAQFTFPVIPFFDIPATPKPTAEVEAKLKELVERMTTAKEKIYAKRMGEEIQELVKTTGLAADKAKALEAPAQQASAASLKQWSAKATTLLRRTYAGMGDQALQILLQAMPRAEEGARAAAIPNVTRPSDQPVWTEAVKAALTPEQAEAWAKVLEERQAKLKKEIAAQLKPMVDSALQEAMQPLLARSGEVKRALSLPPDRAEKLDAAAKQIAEHSVDVMRAHFEKVLLSTDDRPRVNLFEQWNFINEEGEATAPEDPQVAWKAALAKFLTPDEAKTVEGAKQQRQERRVRALARLLVAELDQKVAFTAQQREKLEPIAVRLIKEMPELAPDDGRENMNLQIQSLLAAGTKAKDEELQPILDAVQLKHWKEACQSSAVNSGNDGQEVTAKAEAGGPSPEPEETERGISTYLYKKAEYRRKDWLAQMTLKAEDAARVAALAEATRIRLQTAAKGAAEESMAAWREQAEQAVRSNLGDPNSGSLRQRLANMGDYYFQRDFTGEKHVLWDRTVQAELDAAQLTAWRKETDLRKKYRDQAVPDVVLSEFDRKHPLTSEQYEKLEPKVVNIIREYATDFASYYSNQTTPWYLHYYMVSLPLAGIPDTEMKAILAKDQWDQWTQSNEHSNVENMWSNLKQNHDQRVRAEKSR